MLSEKIYCTRPQKMLIGLQRVHMSPRPHIVQGDSATDLENSKRHLLVNQSACCQTLSEPPKTINPQNRHHGSLLRPSIHQTWKFQAQMPSHAPLKASKITAYSFTSVQIRPPIQKTEITTQSNEPRSTKLENFKPKWSTTHCHALPEGLVITSVSSRAHTCRHG